MNVNLDRLALELGRAHVARIIAEQRADEAEQALKDARANLEEHAVEEVRE